MAADANDLDCDLGCGLETAGGSSSSSSSSCCSHASSDAESAEGAVNVLADASDHESLASVAEGDAPEAAGMATSDGDGEGADGPLEVKDVANAALAPSGATPPAQWGRSDWGLFRRRSETVRRVDDGQGVCRSLTYLCAGKEITFLKPIEGAGTNLMHGDFARKLSPSEEAMTLYIVKHRRHFAGRRVLVLGAGLGLAGLTCAVITEATCVHLTDGDPEVVGTLAASMALNKANFGSTETTVRQLYWSETGEQMPDSERYDCVLAADVVYLEQFHGALLGSSSRALRPGGLFLMIASKRNGSLDKFVTLARTTFPSTQVSDDYDADVTKAIRRSSKCFPIMVRLAHPPQGEEIPDFVAKLCAQNREKQLERQRQEARQRKREERQRRRQRDRNATMAECRLARLEEARRRAEDEAALAEMAAAEAARAEAKPRQPTVSHAEQAGVSDWGLFPRRCTFGGENDSYKEMAYDCLGQEVLIRKPLSGEFFHGDFARKVSPSEEVLALYIAKHHRLFRRKRILVLGAGLGFAGLVAAAKTTAKAVDITDGDETCVALLKDAIELNRRSFTAKKVAAKRLYWGEGLGGMKKYDFVLAADVVYLEDFHHVLLKTLRRLLKPSGIVIFFASPRNGSLDAFTLAASGVFDRVDISRDYDKDVDRAMHGMKCFPRLIRMQWTDQAMMRNSSSRRSTTTQRPSPSPTAVPAAMADAGAVVAKGGGAQAIGRAASASPACGMRGAAATAAGPEQRSAPRGAPRRSASQAANERPKAAASARPPRPSPMSPATAVESGQSSSRGAEDWASACAMPSPVERTRAQSCGDSHREAVALPAIRCAVSLSAADGGLRLSCGKAPRLVASRPPAPGGGGHCGPLSAVGHARLDMLELSAPSSTPTVGGVAMGGANRRGRSAGPTCAGSAPGLELVGVCVQSTPKSVDGDVAPLRRQALRSSSHGGAETGPRAVELLVGGRRSPVDDGSRWSGRFAPGGRPTLGGLPPAIPCR